MPHSDRGRDAAAGADWPLALLVVVSAGLVHTPILGHYFRSDDFAHLYNLANFGLLHFVSTPYGGHLLVIRNAIFSLHHQLFGLNAQLYFIAVLLTHMLNAYLLFRALRLFTGRATLAAFAAALFGMAPVGEGALGWYSAYCHVLVGTILLWVLCDIARLNPPAGSAGFHLGATCFIADLDGNGRGEVLAAAALNRSGAGIQPVGASTRQSSGGALRGRLFIVWDDNFPSAPWPVSWSTA